MVNRLCTDRKILYVHVKNQIFSTQCLKVSCKVKVSDRFTECQNDGMTERQTAVNIDSCSILKKNPPKPQVYSLKAFPKV